MPDVGDDEKLALQSAEHLLQNLTAPHWPPSPRAVEIVARAYKSLIEHHRAEIERLTRERDTFKSYAASDVVLERAARAEAAEAALATVTRERDAWIETARQHCGNEEYYRGLVQRIGKTFGAAAYISDDGSVQQDVLCAKVPELAEAAQKRACASLADKEKP